MQELVNGHLADGGNSLTDIVVVDILRVESSWYVSKLI